MAGYVFRGNLGLVTPQVKLVLLLGLPAVKGVGYYLDRYELTPSERGCWCNLYRHQSPTACPSASDD